MDGRLAAGVLAACAAIGCGGGSPSRQPPPTILEVSRSQWRARADAAGDTYSYQVKVQGLAGFGPAYTVFQFESGVPTYRAFVGDPSLPPEWEERGAEIGSHPGAAPPDTIDTLYDRCADEVLTMDPNANMISLDFDDRGVLILCTYRPNGCADACDMGVWLSVILLGKIY